MLFFGLKYSYFMFAYCIVSPFKLRLQDLAFFDHLSPSVYIFYGIKVYK